MAVRIRSLVAAGPVIVPLNSGRTVRLSPGRSSAELPDVEVAGSPTVEKLLRRRLIELDPAGEPADEPAAQPAAWQPAAARQPAAGAEAPEADAEPAPADPEAEPEHGRPHRNRAKREGA
jgi:hypothetical protein